MQLEYKTSLCLQVHKMTREASREVRISGHGRQSI